MRTFTTFTLISGFMFVFLAACAGPTASVTPENPATVGQSSEAADVADDESLPGAVRAARSSLAIRLNTEDTSITVVDSQETEWSDSCLGLGGPAESCLAVITPGYGIVLGHLRDEYRYRTNSDGTVVRAEE